MTGISAELQKEFEAFLESSNTTELSRGLRNLLCEYLAQNATNGLSIYLDDTFFNSLQGLFIFLDKIENEHGKNELKASA